MIILPGFLGCDISKHHLDIFDGCSGALRLDNTLQAIEPWLDGLLERPDDARPFVVFEATGRYGRRLARALSERGIAHARVNPAAVRAFARATGRLAKTDAIDARLLASFGELLAPQASFAFDEARTRLAGTHLRRDQLVAMRVQERQRLIEAEAVERDSLERHIAFLDDEIALIEQTIAMLVAANPTFARLQALLLSIPGIGTVGATTLIAMMAELGTLSPKQIAALAGLAPFNVDSGLFRGRRVIRGGRKRVRDALYMAAVTAARSNSHFAAYAKAMRERGKPFKVTMIALARKILVTANAIVRDGVPFHP